MGQIYIDAIDVIPNDSINIPQPGSLVSGTSTGSGTTLTDASAKFLNSSTNALGYNITGGDVVRRGNGTEAEILSVDSDTQLTLKTSLTAGTYEIFKGNSAKTSSDGYSLYVGTTGNLAVITVKGTEVVINNVKDGEQLDLQVVRVLATNTTASNITALELE